MKTVLVSILQAVEVKNLLRTSVIDNLLKDSHVRVICIARYSERLDYYREQFQHERLIFDVMPSMRRGIFERVFSILKFHLIRTKTTDLRRRMHRDESTNIVLSRLVYLLSTCLNRIIARPIVRSMIRWLDLHFVSIGTVGEIFRKYHPDVLLLANMFDDAEIALLRESKRRGIPSVGFINSWDKLTARAGVRLLPDKLVVYNEIVKDEAIQYADFAPAKISVCGIPQYDLYFTAKPRSRETVMSELGFNSTKKLILFGPIGSYFGDTDWQAIDLLYSLITEDRIIKNAELLVRFQPNDFIDQAELDKRPWLKYDLPGIRYGSERGGDWDMTERDMERLRDELVAASVVVSYASSLSVDAAVMGVPIINIDFEVVPKEGRAVSKIPTFYYRTEHYIKALESGGIKLVKNERELIKAMNDYLINSDIDKEGRARFVREQCFRTDGEAGDCLAKSICDFL